MALHDPEKEHTVIDTIFGFERGDDTAVKVAKVFAHVAGLLAFLAFLAFVCTPIWAWYSSCN